MLRDSKAFSGFSAGDIPKVKEFYTGTLGLDVSESHDLLTLQLAGGKTFYLPKPNHVPASFTVLNFPVKDVDFAVDELTKRGVRFEMADLPISRRTRKESCGEMGPPLPGLRIPGNILSVIEETAKP